MSRRMAREYALQVLYSRELNPETEKIDGDELNLSARDREFADTLIHAVTANDDIDGVIEKNLTNWSLKQLNVVDKNILRLALAEFLHMKDIASDRNVIINEAIELAKTFGGESSYRFINGVLNQAMKGE